LSPTPPAFPGGAPDDPIILTGRGGSGTRLLAALVESGDVFLGSERNAFGDSLAWIETSYALLAGDIRVANGRFDDAWCERMRQVAAHLLSSSPGAHLAWGWKLPETMFYLPEIMRAFPRARVVHLVRHPVTLSLRRTHVSSRLGNPVGDVVLPRAYRSLGFDVAQIATNPEHLNNAISWQYQVESVTRYADAHLSSSQYHLLRYEDLCRSPQDSLDRIYDFVGLPRTSAVDLALDASRMRQHPSGDPRVAEVWSLCGRTAMRLGYRTAAPPDD